MQSPRSICPVAIRFDIGCTSSRSMARLRGRAPYLKSVPSVSKNYLALAVKLTRNGLPAAAIWIRCCTISSSMSTIRRSSSWPRDLKTTSLSRRLMNSGVNFRRAAAIPLRDIRSASFASQTEFSLEGTWNPSRGLNRALISVAPRLLVKKTMAAEKSTLRLSPSVKMPLSRMPRRRFHNASDAFSISSNKTKLGLTFPV